jgi:hypothetical protein
MQNISISLNESERIKNPFDIVLGSTSRSHTPLINLAYSSYQSAPPCCKVQLRRRCWDLQVPLGMKNFKPLNRHKSLFRCPFLLPDFSWVMLAFSSFSMRWRGHRHIGTDRLDRIEDPQSVDLQVENMSFQCTVPYNFFKSAAPHFFASGS